MWKQIDLTTLSLLKKEEYLIAKNNPELILNELIYNIEDIRPINEVILVYKEENKARVETMQPMLKLLNEGWWYIRK